MKSIARSCVVLAAIILVLIPVFAQDPPPTQEAAGPAPAANGGGQRGGGAARGPRPYDQVITKEAKTDKGVFYVHKVGESYYYEIPKAMLGKEFLWVSQIQKNTIGAGYGGSALGNRVVKWERQGNRVFLRNVNYEIVADPASRCRMHRSDTVDQLFRSPAERVRRRSRLIRPGGCGRAGRASPGSR